MKRILRPAIRIANVCFARKPQFVVIGTPRSGTNYFSVLCRANGVICSHEDYFTEYGPILRNPNRRFDTIGDVSWLAPPFLPEESMKIIHQVRNPLKVVRSIHSMGLFHREFDANRRPFIELLRKHFSPDDDPLRSAMRFYVEWNAKCEDLTQKRYQVERLDEERYRLGDWLGIDLNNLGEVSKSTNTRTPVIKAEVTLDCLSKFPEFKEFWEMAGRYGYDLNYESET